ncbi:MAG: hypothetical protein ABFR82_16805 [Nitrospirota bacterium]
MVKKVTNIEVLHPRLSRIIYRRYYYLVVSLILLVSCSDTTERDRPVTSPFFGEFEDVRFNMTIKEVQAIKKSLEYVYEDSMFSSLSSMYADKNSVECESAYYAFKDKKLSGITCQSHKSSKFDQYYIEVNNLLSDLIKRWGKPTTSDVRRFFDLGKYPGIYVGWKHKNFSAVFIFLPKLGYEKQVKDGRKELVDGRSILSIYAPKMTETIWKLNFNKASIYEEIKEDINKETDIIQNLFKEETGIKE